MKKIALPVMFSVFPGICLPLVAVAEVSPKDLFEKTCSRCHETAIPLGQSFDKATWEATVERMSGYAEPKFGAAIPAEDRKVIVDYLVKTAPQK